MRKILSSLIPAALLCAASPAFAGGSEGSIGVGAESQIAFVDFGGGFGFGLGGVSANYDMGQFHVGGFLGFEDGGEDDDTFVAIGGRFYYHIHSTAMSDFGVGGSVGMGFIGDGNPDNENPQVMLLEPGVQVRAFIASNVALSFGAGITIGLLDADGVALTGQANGSAGFHYYFF
jgi:hypothetical protein